MENAAASGRYLCAGESIGMRAVVDLLARNGWAMGRKLPRLSLDSRAGDLVVELASYRQP